MEETQADVEMRGSGSKKPAQKLKKTTHKLEKTEFETRLGLGIFVALTLAWGIARGVLSAKVHYYRTWWSEAIFGSAIVLAVVAGVACFITPLPALWPWGPIVLLVISMFANAAVVFPLARHYDKKGPKWERRMRYFILGMGAIAIVLGICFIYNLTRFYKVGELRKKKKKLEEQVAQEEAAQPTGEAQYFNAPPMPPPPVQYDPYAGQPPPVPYPPQPQYYAPPQPGYPPPPQPGYPPVQYDYGAPPGAYPPGAYPAQPPMPPPPPM